MSQELKSQIRERYAAAARAAAKAEGQGQTATSGCCGDSAGGGCCGGTVSNSPITQNLYLIDQLEEVPSGAALASLGCGNPTALAELSPGETVLDLGSGGGIDVLLSARRVGPTGKAYGIDMTDEMLELARRNQQEAGVENVEFLKGEIEAIPLPDSSVDVIISNCVVNLSPDKDRVFAEAFRVLKPGGRLAISDMVFQGDISLLGPDLRQQVEAWAGCVAGALEEQDYLSRLQSAGFAEAAIEVTRVYDGEVLSCCGAGTPEGVRLVSGFIRARKPE